MFLPRVEASAFFGEPKCDGSAGPAVLPDAMGEVDSGRVIAAAGRASIKGF